MERVGLLLVNLGTPATPGVRDVRRYLREFLSDPRVLDIPAWKRFLLLELLILPTRPKASAAAYRKIWTAEGSPLLVHARALAAKLGERLGGALEVELAMRYGEPSIGRALDRLESAGVSRIVLFPLFPHWSAAATGSAVARVYELAARRWNTPVLQTIPPFYAHPAYLDARAEVARPILAETDPEIVFMTAHGLPERQIRRSDATGGHCLVRDGCCDAIGEANRFCYRAHCFDAARRLGERLGLPREKVIVCFQSRLGRTPWLRPYTDEVLAAEARRGARNAVILSTGFVADCLETLEELGIRGVETWRENGGERLSLVPALNAAERWVDAIVAIARDGSSWFAEAAAGARS